MMDLDDLINLAAIEIVEDVEELLERRRRVYVYDDPLIFLTDAQFKSEYRLTKALANELIDILQLHIPGPNRTSALTVSRKVLTALRFFASGSYQADVGHNINNSVSQASVSRCIEEVIDALNHPNVFNRFVQFPRNFNELRQLRTKFQLEHHFPGLIGCIDCTHIAIVPPSNNDADHPENAYFNRKSYHSINVQLICDPDLLILNVNARFPGSTHDSFILNTSAVSTFMSNLHDANHKSFYFLGDSGYPLRSWLLTPFANPIPNSPQERFNNAHKHTRSMIERCNGVLKMRFRCLLKHRVLHYTPEKASRIINACVILHNMCILNNVEDDGLQPDENFDFGIYDVIGNGDHRIAANPELVAGRRQRDLIVRTRFIVEEGL